MATTDTYELKLDEFSGPIEKLLELVEERKLEVTRLSLAEVTADFFRYIETLHDISPRTLADFIAVAAKLILIKSATLFPDLEFSEAEKKEAVDLERRLKFYQEFRQAEKYLKRRWQRQVAFARDYLSNLPAGFYLAEEVKLADLLKEIERMTQELATLSPEVKQEEVRLITLEEKISELIERLDRALQASFNSIADGKERSETIVLFLALLHLLKEALVRVEQDELFSDIRIFNNRNG